MRWKSYLRGDNEKRGRRWGILSIGAESIQTRVQYLRYLCM